MELRASLSPRRRLIDRVWLRDLSLSVTRPLERPGRFQTTNGCMSKLDCRPATGNETKNRSAS